jgi:hypothetical protein
MLAAVVYRCFFSLPFAFLYGKVLLTLLKLVISLLVAGVFACVADDGCYSTYLQFWYIGIFASVAFASLVATSLDATSTCNAGEDCFSFLEACVLALLVVASGTGTVESSGGRSDDAAVNNTYISSSITSSTSVGGCFD